jgi:hypothetical protein
MAPFEELQNTIQQLLPIVLIGPGLVFAGSGLFMWLGGLRWLKAIAAFSAAIAGALCAWLFTDRQLAPMVLFPVILAGLGVYFNRIIVVLLGGAVIGCLVLFVPVLMTVSEKAAPANQPAVQEYLNLPESVGWVQEKVEQLKKDTKEMIAGIGQSRKTAAIGAAVIVCAIGIFSWRLVCAVTCSILGTVLIACGMTVLLLYKGASPVTLIVERRLLLGGIIAAMIVAGVLIQLWLCPVGPKKKNKDEMMKEILNAGDKT